MVGLKGEVQSPSPLGAAVIIAQMAMALVWSFL